MTRSLADYRGTFPDGREFDSSYKRGEPATFGVNQVIKGWGEALPLMKKGANHPIEKVGARLRGMMPWMQKRSIKGTQASY